MAGVSSRWRLSVIYQRGQTVIETAIILPLVLLVSLLVMQLLWITWQQYTLWTASSYVLRTAALQSLNPDAMRNTLAAAMTAVQPQLAEPSDSEQIPYAQLAVALAKSQLWARWAARIEVLQPTAQQLQAQGGAILVDHNALRYQASDDSASYLAARTIELEIWWCMPLRVPMAAEALALLRRPLANPVQRFCLQRQSFSEAPLWGLRYRLTGPLLSPYRASD